MSRRGHGAVYIRHAADKHGKKKEGGEDPWCLLCSSNLRLEGRTFVRLSEDEGAELRGLFSKILAIENRSDFPSNDVCSKCERTLRRLSRQQTSAAAFSEAERMRAALEATLRRCGQEPVVSEEGVKFWEVAAEAASSGGSPQVARPRLGKVISAVGSFRRKGSLDKAQRQQQQRRLGSEGSSLDRRDSNASTESGDSSLSGRSFDVNPRRFSDASSDVFAPPSAVSGSDSPSQGTQPKWGWSSKYATLASTSTPPDLSLASSPSPPPASVDPAFTSNSLSENPAHGEVDRGNSALVLSGRPSSSDVQVAADDLEDFECSHGDRDSASHVDASSRVVIDSDVDSETVTDSSISVCSFTEDLPMETTETNESRMRNDSAPSRSPKGQPRVAPGPGQPGTKGHQPRDARSSASPGAGASTSARTGAQTSRLPTLGMSQGKSAPSSSSRPPLVPRNAAKRAIPTTMPSPASKKSFGFVASQVVGVNQFKKKASSGAAASQTRKAGSLPRPTSTPGASPAPKRPSQKPVPAVRSILKKAGEEKASSHLEEYGIAKSVSFSAEALEGTELNTEKDVDASTPESPLDVDYVHEQVDEHFCFLEAVEGQDASSPGFVVHGEEGVHDDNSTDLHSEARNDHVDGKVAGSPVPGRTMVGIRTIQLSESSPTETPAESHLGTVPAAKSTATEVSTSQKDHAAVKSFNSRADTLEAIANGSSGKGPQPMGDADGERKPNGMETGEGGRTLAEQMEMHKKLETYVLEECEGDLSRAEARDREAGERFLEVMSHSSNRKEVSRFIFPDISSQNANINSGEAGRDFDVSSSVEAGNIGCQAGGTGIEGNHLGSTNVREDESASNGGPLKVSSPKECRIPTLNQLRKVSPPSEPQTLNNGEHTTTDTASASQGNTSSSGGEAIEEGVEVPNSRPISSLISTFEIISKKNRKAGFVRDISTPGAEVRRTASDVTHDAVRKWRKSALPMPKLGTSALTQTTSGSSTASIDSAQQTCSSGTGDGSTNENFSVATWPRHSGIPKAYGQRAPILGRRQMNFRAAEDQDTGLKGHDLRTERHKPDETPLIANEATAEREEDDEEVDENKKCDNDNEMPFDFFKKKAKEAPAEESAATNAAADTADSKAPLKPETVENGAPPPTPPKPETKTEGAATQNSAKGHDNEADGGTAPASKTSPAPAANQDQGEKGEGDAKAEEGQVKQMDIKEPRSENSPLIEKESKLKDAQPGFLCCTIM